MAADINPEFKEANAAIEEAALVFVEKIVELFGKREEVRPSYILETALLGACPVSSGKAVLS